MRPPELLEPGSSRGRGQGRRPGSAPARRDGLTRRQVLLGGGGLALVALAAAAGLEHSRLTGTVERAAAGLHTASSSRATVTYQTFPSRVLGKNVAYGIALPAGVTAGTPLPVCFCLPGRGGGPDSVLGAGLEMPRFLDEVVRGKAKPFALAAVAGGQSYWHRRADGEDRMAMLVEELIPLCERRHNLGGGRSRRAAMGWSMGGYGVLLAAETYPHLFSAVVATAPAVWPSYQAMMLGPGDVFDSAADFAAHDVIGHAALLAGTPLLVECGTADPFYPYVRDLCARLPAGSHYRFSPGGHANAYWRGLEPAPLEFVAHHLGVLPA
jgi:enterochelin esterase-like enzyme